MSTKLSLRKSEISHLFEFLRSKYFPLFIPVLVIYIFLQIERRFTHKTTRKVVILYISMLITSLFVMRRLITAFQLNNEDCWYLSFLWFRHELFIFVVVITRYLNFHALWNDLLHILWFFFWFYYMLYLNIYFYLALYLPYREPAESSKIEGRERKWRKYSNRFREAKLKMWNWT